MSALPREKKAPLGASFWQNLTPSILSIARRKKAHLKVLVRSDEFMKNLERKHLGKIKLPVSILSFPASLIGPGAKSESSYLGEIFLNRDYLRGLSERDALRLLIHGILHLLGYHHDGVHDNIIMTREEDRILEVFFPTGSLGQNVLSGHSKKIARAGISKSSNQHQTHELSFLNRARHRNRHR